jgi:predicted CoA-substrate-specific enzyme activase
VKALGIDVGSLETKVVILENGQVMHRHLISMSAKGEVIAQTAIAEALAGCNLTKEDIDYSILTSHIRMEAGFVDSRKNFLVCLGRGSVSLVPDAKTIIDVGAENVSIVSLDKNGKIRDYARNDKCAAGSGVFLEAMAKMMGLTLEDMISQAMKAEKGAPIASTCTVFAEQEVLSTVFEADPPSRSEILAGVHDALASRVVGLAMNVGIKPPILLCGGVANNRAFVKSMNEQIDGGVLVPESPQFVAALGAALMGL